MQDFDAELTMTKPPSLSIKLPTEKPPMDVFAGIRWSAIGTWGSQFMQFIVTIVLARLLAPEDYGLLAMATIVTGFLAVLKTMGVGAVVEQRREVTDTLLSSLFWFNNAVAILLSMATLAAAPICAWLFEESRLVSIMSVLSFNFFLSSPSVIPASILARSMRFDLLAAANLSAQFVGAAVAFSLAVGGSGVWALVISSLFISAINTSLVLYYARWRPAACFSWPEISTTINFGLNVTGFSIVNYWSRRIDNLIVGVLLGAQSLGLYSMAYSLMLRPMQMTKDVILRVLFPKLSRLQDDEIALGRAHLRTIGAITFVAFPIMVGLSLVARPFVSVVLGDTWSGIVPLIWLFAPTGGVQCILAANEQLLLVKNRSELLLRLGLLKSILITLSFTIGVTWGLVGVAAAYLVMCLAWTPVNVWIAARQLRGLRSIDIWLAVAPNALLTCIMSAIVLLCDHILAMGSVDERMRLAVLVVVGVTSYALAAAAVGSPALADLKRIIPIDFLKKSRIWRPAPESDVF